MKTIDTGEKIVMETQLVPRVASHPQNEKILDSLLIKIYWTKDDVDLLDRCLRNYDG